MTTLSSSSVPVTGALSVFDGQDCVYEGPVEFALGTKVAFTFVNASEDVLAGYSIWKVPDGRTTDDIIEHGILGIGTHLVTDMRASSQPSEPGEDHVLDVTLDKPGSWAVNCFVPDGGTGIDHPAAVVEVSSG
jgi:hypothetical protein